MLNKKVRLKRGTLISFYAKLDRNRDRDVLEVPHIGIVDPNIVVDRSDRIVVDYDIICEDRRTISLVSFRYENC